MKIRLGFVTNSSSSSFIITDKNHPGVLHMLLDGLIEDLYEEFTDDGDNDTWNWCSKHGYEWDEFLRQTAFNG